jgi:hypothetical protein
MKYNSHSIYKQVNTHQVFSYRSWFAFIWFLDTSASHSKNTWTYNCVKNCFKTSTTEYWRLIMYLYVSCEHKVDMCPCGSDLWWMIVNMICILGWVCKLTMEWFGLCNMSLGLWCVGVELEGGGRRWGEGHVGTCRADGLGAVKDGYQAWTEGPGGWETSYGGWNLGTSTSASVHESDRIERVKMTDVQVERRLWKTW